MNHFDDLSPRFTKIALSYEVDLLRIAFRRMGKEHLVDEVVVDWAVEEEEKEVKKNQGGLSGQMFVEFTKSASNPFLSQSSSGLTGNRSSRLVLWKNGQYFILSIEEIQ